MGTSHEGCVEKQIQKEKDEEALLIAQLGDDLDHGWDYNAAKVRVIEKGEVILEMDTSTIIHDEHYPKTLPYSANAECLPPGWGLTERAAYQKGYARKVSVRPWPDKDTKKAGAVTKADPMLTQQLRTASNSCTFSGCLSCAKPC